MSVHLVRPKSTSLLALVLVLFFVLLNLVSASSSSQLASSSLPPSFGPEVFDFLNGEKILGIHAERGLLNSLTLSSRNLLFLDPAHLAQKNDEWRLARARTAVPLQKKLLRKLLAATVFAHRTPETLIQPSWENLVFGLVCGSVGEENDECQELFPNRGVIAAGASMPYALQGLRDLRVGGHCMKIFHSRV